MSNAKVIVWRAEHDPCPWLFAVVFEGRRWEFGGVPNYCRTRRQAAIRGWWRARWLEDWTFNRRYV